MAKRALKVEKPIEDMLKAELVVELKQAMKTIQGLRHDLASAIAVPMPQHLMPTKKRWAVYGRCSS